MNIRIRVINSGCTLLDFLFDRRLEPDEMDSDEEEEEDDDFDFRYLYHTLLKIYYILIFWKDKWTKLSEWSIELDIR